MSRISFVIRINQNVSLAPLLTGLDLEALQRLYHLVRDGINLGDLSDNSGSQLFSML